MLLFSEFITGDVPMLVLILFLPLRPFNHLLFLLSLLLEAPRDLNNVLALRSLLLEHLCFL